jgi:hypothetical protein
MMLHPVVGMKRNEMRMLLMGRRRQLPILKELYGMIQTLLIFVFGMDQAGQTPYNDKVLSLL